MDEVNIIGLDPSLCNSGFVVSRLNRATGNIDEIIKLTLSETAPDNTKGVKRADDDLVRFRQHWNKFNELIDVYNVTHAIGEIPSGAQDARAAFAFGGCTMMLAACPIPLVTVTPAEAKLVTGSKHADKEDMIEFAYNKFPDAAWFLGKKSNKMNIRTPAGLYLQNKNEHLADAVCITYAGLPKLKFK